MLTLAAMMMAAADPAACPRCDQKLDLTAQEWTCLRAQLPRLQSQRTPFVFFSLGAQQCAGGESFRSADTRLPETTTSAPRVYRLTTAQVACLARNTGRVSPAAGRYRIDLAATCPPSQK